MLMLPVKGEKLSTLFPDRGRRDLNDVDLACATVGPDRGQTFSSLQ